MSCKTIIRLRGGILFFFLNALAVALLSPCSLLSAAPNPNGQPNADFSQARLSTLYQTMIRLGEAGDFEAAIPVARQALSLSESLFGLRHATTGNFAFNVGEMYRSAGHYYEAVPFFKR